MVARETVITPNPDLTLANPGQLIITPEEQLLVKDPALRQVFMPWLAQVESDGWTSVNTGLLVPPASGHSAPTARDSGGPDNVPYISAGANTPVGVLQSASAVFPTTTAWTMAVVAKAGSVVGCGIMGSSGNNGNGLIIVLRTSDLCRVFSTGDGLVETQLLTAAATSADWHLVELSYNPTSDLLSLYIDGVLAASDTVALTFGGSRITFFGSFDTADGVDNQGQNASIAFAALLDGAISDSASLKALIENAVLSRMPGLY